MNHWRIINSLEKEGRKNSTIINPSLISIGVTWRRKKTVDYGHPKHGNRSQLIHPITVNNTRNTRPRRYRAYKKGARIDCSARGREEHEVFIRASQVNYYHLPLPPFLPFHNPFFPHGYRLISLNDHPCNYCYYYLSSPGYNILDGDRSLQCCNVTY